MYKKEFDKLQNLPKYLLFYGDKFYLKEYEQKILERFKNGDVLKMGYDDFDFERAKRHLGESSLFGGESVLVVRSERVIEPLKELIKHIRDGYLFFFYYGDKKPNLFGKNFVRFFEPTLKEKIEHINILSQKYRVNLSLEAKRKLALMVDGLLIEREMEKLSLYSNEIGVKELEELVFFYKEDSFEEIVWEILSGRDFLEKISFMLNFVDYRRFLPFVIRYIKELYRYNLYIKKSASSSLEGLLGYRLPYEIEKNRLNFAVKIKEREFYELLKNLLEFEFRMRKNPNEAVFWEAVLFLRNFFSKL